MGPRKLGLASEGLTLMNKVLAIFTWQRCDGCMEPRGHEQCLAHRPLVRASTLIAFPTLTGSCSWTCAAETANYPLVPLSPSTVQLCHWEVAARVTSSLLSREM